MTDTTRRQTGSFGPLVLGRKDAVRQIKQSYDWALSKKRASPFFFVIGAGVSVPQVPLAAEIIRQCRERCGITDGQAGPLDSNEYSRWLNEAFHAPEMRQDFFRQLIEGKPIPSAHLRLAHLLLGEGMKQPFTNLVVTTNFDNFLSRALSLFGKEHILCDSPNTAQRLVLSNPELLQIVHVHGSYQFYDMKNLSDELKIAAALSDDTTATMSSLLESLLRDRSPIVVGYGGWGDVFMFSLRRRLRGGGLPQPLYWCCYRRGDWRALPDWLRDDPNIRFVEPDPPPPGGPPASESAAGELNRRPSADNAPSPRTSGAPGMPSTVGPGLLQDAGVPSKDALDAQAVFDELIQVFSIPEPALTKNPVAFFADQLDHSLPQEESSTRGADPYRIKLTILEMRAAARWVDEYRLQRSAAQQALQRAGALLREANYAEAIEAILAIELDDLNQSECDDLLAMAFEVVESATFGSMLSERTLDLLKRIEKVAPLATERPDTTKRVVLARFMIPMNLASLHRGGESVNEIERFIDYVKGTGNADAVVLAVQLLINLAASALGPNSDVADAVLKIVLVSFGDSKEDRVQPLLAVAVAIRASLLQLLKSYEESLTLSEMFLANFQHLSDPRIAAMTALVMSTKAFALAELGRETEALDVSQELLRRFGDSAEPEIRGHVARALVNRGFTLQRLNRTDEAIAVYDDLMRRFGDVAEPSIRQQVSIGLMNKAVARDQPEEAIGIYDSVLKFLADAEEPILREQAARALMFKSLQLGGLKRNDEAISVCRDLDRRFGESLVPSILLLVVNALVYQAALLDELGRGPEALAVYDDLDRRFAAATEPAIRQELVRALINKADTFRRQQDEAAERIVYEQLITRFGDDTETSIREQVGEAFNRQGFWLLRQAKTAWRPDNDNRFIATLKEAEQKIDKALEYSPGQAIILGNKGYILFLQGRTTEAAGVLADALRLGGEDLRTAELGDAEINPIPRDEEFKALIRGIEITPPNAITSIR